MFDISQFISIDYDQLCSIFVSISFCPDCRTDCRGQGSNPSEPEFFFRLSFCNYMSDTQTVNLTCVYNTAVLELLNSTKVKI